MTGPDARFGKSSVIPRRVHECGTTAASSGRTDSWPIGSCRAEGLHLGRFIPDGSAADADIDRPLVVLAPVSQTVLVDTEPGRGDHIHIAVNLVREDGAKASTHYDYKKGFAARGRAGEEVRSGGRRGS